MRTAVSTSIIVFGTGWPCFASKSDIYFFKVLVLTSKA